MEVILLDKIDKLGNLGEVCKVKSGYARNFLFPQKKALPASEESKKKYEAMRIELEQKLQEKLDLSKSWADKARDLQLSFSRRASEEGKLYGSININDIADALKEKNVQVEKKQINMFGGAIRHTGEFTVELRFDADNVVELPIEVTPLVQES